MPAVNEIFKVHEAATGRLVPAARLRERSSKKVGRNPCDFDVAAGADEDICRPLKPQQPDYMLYKALLTLPLKWG